MMVLSVHGARLCIAQNAMANAVGNMRPLLIIGVAWKAISTHSLGITKILGERFGLAVSPAKFPRRKFDRAESHHCAACVVRAIARDIAG